MTQKPQIIKVIADALRAAVDTIDAAITEIDTAIAAAAAEQPVQGAETATGDVQPKVITAAVDVVAAAEVVEEKRDAIEAAYVATDVATESYDEKLAKAIEILKGGK